MALATTLIAALILSGFVALLFRLAGMKLDAPSLGILAGLSLFVTLGVRRLLARSGKPGYAADTSKKGSS